MLERIEGWIEWIVEDWIEIESVWIETEKGITQVPEGMNTPILIDLSVLVAIVAALEVDRPDLTLLP